MGISHIYMRGSRSSGLVHRDKLSACHWQGDPGLQPQGRDGEPDQGEQEHLALGQVELYGIGGERSTFEDGASRIRSSSHGAEALYAGRGGEPDLTIVAEELNTCALP